MTSRELEEKWASFRFLNSTKQAMFNISGYLLEREIKNLSTSSNYWSLVQFINACWRRFSNDEYSIWVSVLWFYHWQVSVYISCFVLELNYEICIYISFFPCWILWKNTLHSWDSYSWRLFFGEILRSILFKENLML